MKTLQNGNNPMPKTAPRKIEADSRRVEIATGFLGAVILDKDFVVLDGNRRFSTISFLARSRSLPKRTK
jgi:hypothetical protein